MKDISLKFDKYSMKRRFGLESNSKINSDAYRTVFPIPQEQIIASSGSLTQNPGY